MEAQAAASFISFTRMVEMARLIRTKKFPAREARVRDMKVIDTRKPEGREYAKLSRECQECFMGGRPMVATQQGRPRKTMVYPTGI